MKNKWSLLEQASFLKMTGELLVRGYPLSDALESLIIHLPKQRRGQIKEGLILLKEGYPFYSILQKLHFDKHLTGYVFFAEKHGGLATAFIEGSKMIESKVKDLTKLKKLFSYPLFLIGTTIILFTFVQKYLLPRFSLLFSTMNLEVNVFTRMINNLDHAVPLLFFLLSFIVGLSIYYYFSHFRKISPLQQKILLMKVPFLSNYLRLFYTHYFSTQLSHLLSGGLSVNEALTLFEQHEDQPFYQQLGKDMKENLRKGEKLERILLHYSFFEKELATIVKHGQENGKLSQELMFFATQCFSRLEEKTEKLMKQLQPILYSLIGLLIVSMYLSVLIPMFQLLDGI
ncbi:competence type IV pilus assembly protein ComGB [Niallia sp. XMNu-256]|uniref:competence type IV pilus assembly protein ComGB n=1 Tax=Niallia sp. XMNu-256 TaxID=3082444 RepID=UPI0030CDF735